MATYVAVTTHNAQIYGWHEVETGTNKVAVYEAALRTICGAQWDKPKDIYVDTELKNLHVVSKTTAKRKFKVDIDAIDY